MKKNRADAGTPQRSPDPRGKGSGDAANNETTMTASAGTQESVPLSAELEERLQRLDGWRRRFLMAVRLKDRLSLLVAFGLTDYDIAKAVPGVAARSVRRWRTEGPPVSKTVARWEAVDDLCSLIGLLIADGTYDEEGIVAWLRSRQPELGNQRPLNVLGSGDFDAVLATVERGLVPAAVDGDAVISPPRRLMPSRMTAGPSGDS